MLYLWNYFIMSTILKKKCDFQSYPIEVPLTCHAVERWEWAHTCSLFLEKSVCVFRGQVAWRMGRKSRGWALPAERIAWSYDRHAQWLAATSVWGTLGNMTGVSVPGRLGQAGPAVQGCTHVHTLGAGSDKRWRAMDPSMGSSGSEMTFCFVGVKSEPPRTNDKLQSYYHSRRNSSKS